MEKSHLNKKHSPFVNYIQYGGGQQYGGGYSVWRRHIIDKVEDIQYKCFTLSAWRRHIISAVERVCSMGLSHHQYRGGCAVQ